MITYLIIALSAVVSITGVFYSKNGQANAVNKVGYTVLALIVILSALAGFDAYESGRSSQEREAELKNNFTRSQHQLVLQWLKPAEEINDFGFYASLDYDDREGFSHTSLPYNMAGASPFFRALDDGEKVGTINIEIGEDVRRGFELFRSGDMLKVHQAIGSGEGAIRSEYLSGGDYCETENADPCEYVYAGGNASWREGSDTGGSGIGIDLTSDVISASIVTSIFEYGQLGNVVVKDALKDEWWWNRNAIRHFYENEIQYGLSFNQKITDVDENSLCSYRYSIRLKLILTNEPDSTDIAGYFLPDGPMSVGLCGLPY